MSVVNGYIEVSWGNTEVESSVDFMNLFHPNICAGRGPPSAKTLIAWFSQSEVSRQVFTPERHSMIICLNIGMKNEQSAERLNDFF